MDACQHGSGLFGIIDTYNEGLAFFKGGDAYPYASGFSAAVEGMGGRIEWSREQEKSLQIDAITRVERVADGSNVTVGITKEGDLILKAFRVRLIDVGGRYGEDHSRIYDLDDCRIHGGLLPIVEFYDMEVNRDRYPDGQVVADYYANMILQHEDGSTGIRQVGHNMLRTIAWEPEEFEYVIEWLTERLDARGCDWRLRPEDR